MMSFTLAQLAQRFGGEIIGDAERKITGIAPLENAHADQLSFITNARYVLQLGQTRAAAVLMRREDAAKVPAAANFACFVVANPYACMARIAQLLVPRDPSVPRAAGIHTTAVVDPSAQIATSAFIGPYVVVDAQAVIGERVRLDAHVCIGHGAQIADDARLYPRVTVYPGCRVGRRTIVHAGAVLGADGFGYAPDFEGQGQDKAKPQGEWVKIPQTGALTIGADVEIGANTTIDRGAIADTVIEDGVKIDNLVQIAHNCKVGAHTAIAAMTGIAGSTVIGRYCMLGGKVGIAGHLSLADRTVITAGSNVAKSLDKAGVYAGSFSVLPHTDWNRNAVLIRHLRHLRERLKQLEATIGISSAGRINYPDSPK